MMQRRRDDSSDATSTQLPLEIILPVAASVVFLLVLALVFVHRMYRKLDAQTNKSVLHSPSLLVMSDLEANRQWLNGLECLRCLGLGRPKSACSFGLEVKCRGEGAFDDDGDDGMSPPTFNALPQKVFFPEGRPSPLSCTTSWFQKSYGCTSPDAKSLFGGEAVPDIHITVPMTAADKATSSFLQNRRWTRAFKHDLGLVNGGMRPRTGIPSECSPLRRLGPRRRVNSAPRALFNLRLARSAALPTITEARESCCSSESGAVKRFVEEASMSKIENRVTAAAGLAPESTLSSITSLPLIVSLSQPSDEEPRRRVSHSSSAPGLRCQHARDVSCGGGCAARNAPSDGTDRLIADSTAIECSSSSSSAAATDDSDNSPSLLPYFDSGLASTAACIPTSSSCCSPSRRLSSGTSDLAYSGCSINNASAGAMATSIVPFTYDCAAAPSSLAGPSHDAGNKRGSLLNGLAGVELWIDEDVDLFYYVGSE